MSGYYRLEVVYEQVFIHKPCKVAGKVKIDSPVVIQLMREVEYSAFSCGICLIQHEFCGIHTDGRILIRGRDACGESNIVQGFESFLLYLLQTLKSVITCIGDEYPVFALAAS